MPIKIPRKFRTTLLIFLVAVIAMSILGVILDSRDSVRPQAERFLVNDKQVHNLVGNVQSYSLYNRVYAEGTGAELPYRKYTFKVRGEKSDATITVRVEDDKGKKRFSIVPF